MKLVGVAAVTPDLDAGHRESRLGAPDKSVERLFSVAFIAPERRAQGGFVNPHAGSVKEHLG